MADQIIPEIEQTQTKPLAFASGIYQLAPDASKIDVIDHLQARLAQLSAMLCTTYGAGFDTFDNWSSEVKENYLWGCASLAQECDALTRRL